MIRCMKFTRLWIVAFALAAALAISPAVADPATDSPATVAQALYRSSLDHFVGFTTDSVKRTKPWVAPELYARLWKKVNEPQPKDEAPAFDGDAFLDCQDPPSTVTAGKFSIDGAKAKVDMKLVWSGETRHYTVLLEQVAGAWKVYDVDFGDDGKLTSML